MPSVCVIFVCSRNKWRSPTAEKVFFNYPNLKVRSAGLSSQSPRTLSTADLAWADIVFVMEQPHKKQILKIFRDSEVTLPEIHVLDIPDEFQFMQPELISLLRETVPQYLDNFKGG